MDANTVITWLKGKKTYATAIAAVVLGILQAENIYTVPGWVWPILAGLGFVTLRAAVSDMVNNLKK